jgi:hypothetical protein
MRELEEFLHPQQGHLINEQIQGKYGDLVKLS